MIRTHTYTAKLSSDTHQRLDEFLEQQRLLWNGALEERINAYQKKGLSLSVYDQMKSLTRIRTEDADFSEVHAGSQRTALIRLDKAFKRFFARVKAGQKPGFPRFKGYGRFNSFETDQFRVHNNGKWKSVSIKGVGRFRFKGEIKGTPRLLRVVRTARRICVQLVCEIADVPVADDRKPLGVDVGITNRVTLSSGYQAPKNVIDRAELKKRQRRVSRAVKGSQSRRKKVLALRKEWQRVAERERGALHELTRRLINEHGAKYYVEDLKIGNMVKNHRLSRSIVEQQWGTFVDLLAYKAAEAGGYVVKVPPHDTSQKCSCCGELPSAKLTLDDRTYDCEHCGYVADRDVNAANNILHIGLSGISGGTVPERREKEDYVDEVPAELLAQDSAHCAEQYADSVQH